MDFPQNVFTPFAALVKWVTQCHRKYIEEIPWIFLGAPLKINGAPKISSVIWQVWTSVLPLWQSRCMQYYIILASIIMVVHTAISRQYILVTHCCLLWQQCCIMSLPDWSHMRPISIYLLSDLKYKPLVGNKIVDHLDVVGASPVGAAPNASSFMTLHLASVVWAKTTATQDERHLSLRFDVPYILGFTLYFVTRTGIPTIKTTWSVKWESIWQNHNLYIESGPWIAKLLWRQDMGVSHDFMIALCSTTVA